MSRNRQGDAPGISLPLFTEEGTAPCEPSMNTRNKRLEQMRPRRPCEGRRGWSLVAGPHLTF